tara:strand:+ start:1100 stop:1738 length:639 start_codon:yes stop_codon:yes gene_type:complete
MELYKCDKYDKIRMGRDYDGGYVIYDDLEYDVIIGCGISNDISFEEMFVDKYKCDSIVFDGTISKLPKHKFNHKWNKKNVYQGTLDLLLKQYDKIFLKIDIEGSEWEFFKDVDLHNVSQMVVEFHSGIKYPNLDMDILKKIEQTHYLIHIHGNNYRKKQYKIYDKIIHSVFEATYINKNLCKEYIWKCEYNYNDELDMPNNKNKSDIKNMCL